MPELSAAEDTDLEAEFDALLSDTCTLTRPPVRSSNPLAPAPGPPQTLATEVACAVQRLSGREVEDLARRGITAAWAVYVPLQAGLTIAPRDGDQVRITAGHATGRTFTITDVGAPGTLALGLGLACQERS